ncbi:MAG TPA: hypothetical protein VGC67_15260 [Cellulomonas sp.]
MPHRPEDPRPDGSVPEGPPADDVAFTRLRAADPATGPEARAIDLDVVRAAVTERVAATSGAAEQPARPVPGQPDPAEHAVAALHDDADTGPAVEAQIAPVVPITRRRPARWLRVAAVVAGAAVVGAGGYAWGHGSGAGAPETAIALDTSPAQSLAGSAAGSTEQWSTLVSGRTVFTASGLSDGTSNAHAWALDAAAVFSAGTAARIAAALGVTGEPTLSWGSWTVGPTDGSGPTVSVQSDGTAGVSYVDPALDPWSCTDGSTTEPSDGAVAGSASGSTGTSAGSSGASAAQDSMAAACGTEPAPTGDAAIAIARDTLVALGVDPDGFALQVEDTGDDTRSSTVTAAQVVDDQQTGLSWSFTLVGDGVQSLYGFLAPLVDLGDYPVVGAATAVDRLGDPRFGAGYGGIVPLMSTESTDSAVAVDPSQPDPAETAEPTVPTTAEPGAAIDWPVQQVTITAAQLGLSQISQTDGAVLLVPTYELTGSDGSAWSVVAVADSALSFTG